ncbi:MAG: GNAT family N-acetyltransferase [Spirochaetaceae bacterium]|nr:GNAT family N-acetyltransferase [Spirochaetaceae bacterium]
MIKIRHIEKRDWSAILRIQTEAYFAIEPESENVMKSKSLASRETCFVVENEQREILAYCLSHPWEPLSAPALNTVISTSNSSGNLYIHDLAVSHAARGKGFAEKLCNQIVFKAQSLGFQRISLVSIQQSYLFWGKMGFKETPEVILSKTYGEQAKFMQLFLI